MNSKKYLDKFFNLQNKTSSFITRNLLHLKSCIKKNTALFWSYFMSRFSKISTSWFSIFSTSKFSKIKILKVSTSVVFGALILSWGITSAINNDIGSASTNFNAMGIVSEVSTSYIIINNAKGSAQSSDGMYSLDLGYLTKVETNTYVPLNLSDIKIGDKIVVQGLTNGYTFFIKRIVSFSSTPTPVVPDENATTTESVATTTESVATTTESVATTTEATTNTSTTTESVATSTSTSTSTTPSTPLATETPKEEPKATTTESVEATTTEPSSTTTSSTDDTATTTASTTPTIIEAITDTVDNVIDKVGEVIQGVVDTVTGGGDSTPALTTSPTSEAPSTPSE